MIVVMRVQEFEFAPKHGALPFPVEIDPDGVIGYLPVYPDLSTAMKDFPNGPFVEVQETEKAQ